MADPISPVAGHPTFTLWAQGQQVALSEGVALQRAQFPMLVPANPGGPVALVNVNPHDPTQLGLRNLTTSAWTATLPDGSQKEIGTDKSVRLAGGTIIQAGPLQWEIRAQMMPAAHAGFVAASEPAIAPQPVMPPQPGYPPPASPFPQAGFVPANTPAAPPPAPMGFVPVSEPQAALAPNPGFILGSPPPAVGFVPDNAPGMPGLAPHRPGGAARNVTSSSSLRMSQLVPVLGERQVLMSKGFLIPGILTVLLVALLSYAGNIKDHERSFGLYADTLTFYIGGGALFFVYRLCGKVRPLWVILLAAAFTALLLSPYFPFVWLLIYPLFNLIGGGDDAANGPILQQFFHFTFTVGLREEFFKSIPVFIAMFLGWRLSSPLREKVGVFEPLDGILLGAASGLGFTVLETLGQYIPQAVGGIATLKTGDSPEALLLAGQGMGLELLIIRVLGVISGHMAYSGYFGYFIGLSVLKPKHRWQILGIGWLTAALIHGLWDTTCDLPGSGPVWMVVIGLTAYSCLIGAILKARQLSPDRVHNFATQIKGVQ